MSKAPKLRIKALFKVAEQLVALFGRESLAIAGHLVEQLLLAYGVSPRVAQGLAEIFVRLARAGVVHIAHSALLWLASRVGRTVSAVGRWMSSSLDRLVTAVKGSAADFGSHFSVTTGKRPRVECRDRAGRLLGYTPCEGHGSAVMAVMA